MSRSTPLAHPGATIYLCPSPRPLPRSSRESAASKWASRRRDSIPSTCASGGSPHRTSFATTFRTSRLAGDVELVDALPPTSVVTAGFPCTDLSQAGRTAGIEGRHSGLVHKALALVADHDATWVLLENVRNMLPLHGGRAMAAITEELERMGFRWAYRVVDSRFTGVPQRRQRVILLASRSEDPRGILFADDAGVRDETLLADDAYGFYWTEGLRGLGWCRDGVPTLKGGSSLGIPSPPAVWIPGNRVGERFVTPGISTAEHLQGFPQGLDGPGRRSSTRGRGSLEARRQRRNRRRLRLGRSSPARSECLGRVPVRPLARWCAVAHGRMGRRGSSLARGCVAVARAAALRTPARRHG